MAVKISAYRTTHWRTRLAASAILAAGLMSAVPAMAGASSEAQKFARSDVMFGGGGEGGAFGTDPFNLRDANGSTPADTAFSAAGDATPDTSDGFSVRSEAEGNVGYDLMVTKKLLKF
jgi:hypothetical protein